MSDYLKVLILIRQDSEERFFLIFYRVSEIRQLIFERFPGERADEFALRILNTYKKFHPYEDEITRELHLGYWSLDGLTRVL